MRWIIASFLCLIGRILLSFRYKIKIKGKKEIKKKNFKKNVGILFLPNHPALVDPIIISILFWPRFRLHPLVVEYVYRQSGINLIMRLLKALSIPNMDTSLNEIKIRNAEGVIEKIIKGLKDKKNYMLYPGGRLKHTGKEIIGGASATQTILNNCPNVNIVLVRSTGLWGSSFSRAFTGRSPDFKTTFLASLKQLLLCGIFFMPRRKVLVEMGIAPKEFPREGSRLEVNKYLENWYNRYKIDDKVLEEEPLNLVSYSCFKKKFYEIKKKDKKQKISFTKKFSSKIEETVFSELSRFQPDLEIKAEMNLATDLGLDSLDVAELITFLNVNFDTGEVHPEDIETVQDVLEVAEGKSKKGKIEKVVSTYAWPDEKKRPNLLLPEADTIFEAFLKTSDRMDGFSSISDDMLGVIPYNKLKLSSLVLADKIRKMPGDNIGILLPASVASYIVILAIMLAGKIPVMLNWTSGPRYLNHMAVISNLKTVISSWKFLERISNVEFGNITNKLTLLEDIKKNISLKTKIKAFLLSLKKADKIISSLKNLKKIKKEDVAVILFTSGTEANPKGVPLTHNNILSNQRATLECIDIDSQKIMYGILPPFHSFGFSVAGLLPILCGMRIAFSPDPTDSYTLAEGIARWKINIICAAPSFLKGILQASNKKQLSSVEIFVSGAEKAPKELIENIKSLGKEKKFLEGYGITECSPILTIVRQDQEPKGVGKPLVGVEFCIVNPETKKPLSSLEKEGELCVRGENVFKGYLEKKEKSPFIYIDSKKWYCTGDLGYLDKEKNVILSGRIKRFVKIGGEMVSLGSIEEIILKELTIRNIDLKEGAPIAVIGKEYEEGKSELVLFTILDLDKTDINMVLKKAGCSRLIKIGKIKKIDRIPLMGSGKVDYRFLQKLLD